MGGKKRAMTFLDAPRGRQIREIFKNRVAIISGGLGDIGQAIAKEFARHGAAISIGDVHSATDARPLMKRFGNAKVLYQQVDVADANAVAGWVNQTEKELGVPDLIIPNAATLKVAGFSRIKPDEWSRSLRVNLDGAFHLAQAATQRLLYNRLPGRVVFLGSWAAHAVHQNIVAYCVAKAGIRMLCKCMAMELAAHHILVNEVAPGYVDGGMSKRFWQKKPAVQERARRRVPVQKLIDAREVALQVIHLCHPDNQHMTGSTLLMDGGLSLRS